MTAIVVGSGKGGVGKSVAAIAFATALADQGRRVLLVDGDQNLGTLHVLLGVQPSASLESLLDNAMPVEDLLAPVRANLWLLPSESGSEALYGLGATDRARLHRRLTALYRSFDVTIIDAGAGLESALRCSTMGAHRLVLVTMPEPAALTDAYAVIKLVTLQVRRLPIDVVVNRARDEADARAGFERLAAASERFLHRGIRYLGGVAEDPEMRDAVRDPARLVAPDGAPAVQALRALAAERFELPPPLHLVGPEVAA